MHIISQKALRDFCERFPDSETALLRWYKIVERTTFNNFAELRTTFPSADRVGEIQSTGGFKRSEINRIVKGT